MKHPEDFFPSQGEVSPRVGFTPELERAEIETQGSKATPKGTLMSEIEQKSKGFFIYDVEWDFISFYAEFLQRLIKLFDPERQEHLAWFYNFENCIKQNYPFLMDQLEEL